jgi:hypothetical protein
LLNGDGTLQTSCVQALPTVLNQLFDAELLRRRFPGAPLWGMSALRAEAGSPAEVEALAGACVMLRREVFDRIGGFSADYFMYGEDMDLCYRTRKAGLRNYYIPDAEVVHHGGRSTQQMERAVPSVIMRESAWRYFLKNHGLAYALAYRATMVVAALVRISLLFLLSPVFLARRQYALWKNRCVKWLAILCWAFGGSCPSRISC